MSRKKYDHVTDRLLFGNYVTGTELHASLYGEKAASLTGADKKTQSDKALFFIYFVFGSIKTESRAVLTMS